MKILPFKTSRLATLGAELEFQIINPITFDLISRAPELIEEIKSSRFKELIKPEVTQSMIEFNSSIHTSAKEMLAELLEMQSLLINLGKKHKVLFSGGGTHPFQKWALQKIYPEKRYKRLYKQYRYLAKRATVFGLHVHVGCPSGEESLYLCHSLGRYVPQFIALSASSPFYQGVDTGYHSARATIFNPLPSSGVVPYLLNWKDFSGYFYKLKRFGIVETMKDFYWDIRPKPEFGTVEIRVCDTPLTLTRAMMIAAYVQTIAYYLLTKKPPIPNKDLYYFYKFNSFQASRYGFDGEFIDIESRTKILIKQDIYDTLNQIEESSQILGNNQFLKMVEEEVQTQKNDSTELRALFHKFGSFPQVVKQQCDIWTNNHV